MTSAQDVASHSPAASPSARRESIPWFELLGIFSLLLLCSWLGIDLSRHSEGVATIWFSNGLLFAIVIRRPRSVWLRYFALGLLADTLADILWGDPARLAFGVSLANSIEVVASSLILTRWFGNPFNLSRRKPLLAFLGIAVIGGPAISSILGTAATMLNEPIGPWWQTVRTWYLGDVLGMAIIAPLAFLLQRPGFFFVLQRRELPRTLLVLTIPAIATILVFGQNSHPLIFAIFPALLFVVFQRGFPGAVLTIFVIACFAIALTVTGHGPLMLIPGRSLLSKIVVVQVFLATALFTALPVAALLEERKALEVSLQQSEAQYRELANTDALTGTRNRRAFDERLAAEWHCPGTIPTSLSLLSIDVDHFKAYNDIYGHLAGDDCLRRITATITDALRSIPAAQLYRLGGEEFAVILPCTGSATALQTADHLRASIVHAAIQHTGSPLGIQTISIGVATAEPRPDTSALSLLTLSDRALYSAKSHGRNRSEVAADPNA
jgi:diguanylate cyclase (GGDEF)-like protein